MNIKLEDMEQSNWITCAYCKNLCKNPNYDFDLHLDECCLCNDSYSVCSACWERISVS